MDAAGVRGLCTLTVLGYDNAPHGHAEVDFGGLVLKPDAVLLVPGRGFEAAQTCLGAGGLYHYM